MNQKFKYFVNNVNKKRYNKMSVSKN